MVQSAQGATFEYTPGAARFDTLVIDGTTYARVTVLGAVSSDAPGRPALPMATLMVGVPDGMSPRLRVTAEEWGDQSGPPPAPVAQETFRSDDLKTAPVSEYRTEPDPATYQGAALYPPEEVSLGKGSAVGEMWVVPIQVRPVRWDPRLHAYRVLHSMTLRVDFVEATDSERAARPAFRPGGDSPAWHRVQQGLVRNYESARSFPIRLRPAPLPAAPVARAANPEFRVSVSTTGWSSLAYSALFGAGFPSGIAINQVAVYQRGWSDAGDSAVSVAIPVVAKDANTNGVFDSGDAITFYVQSLRDRVGSNSIENRYADRNVYWVTWTGSPAATPDSIAGDLGSPSPVIPTSFLDTVHLEQDLVLLSAPNNGVAAPPENVDLLYWTNGTDDTPDVFDTTIPFVSPDVTRPFRIMAWYQGGINQFHRLNIFFQSSTGAKDTLAYNDTFLGQDVYVLNTGFTIPGSLIGPGANHYQHVGERQVNGNWVNGSRAWLNWVEATYGRRYTAQGNALAFTTDGPGSLVELHVGGFTSSNIVVYDVTAPTAPRRVTGVQIQQVATNPDTFAVVFQSDALAIEHKFVAFVPGAETALPASAVVQDTPSALTVPGAYGANSIARSIIIAPAPFLPAATRLADFRRAQGYVVEVADLQDVYDEFNGGIKSARAIRRYLRHAYLTWTPRPTFVILAGDASMDYRHRLAASGADWVPTYMSFEDIAGPQGTEQTAHDSWYTMNLSVATPAETDYVPSVILGRIPASSPTELDQYVTKVIQYENFQDTDTWRGRMLFLSDDEFSSTIYFIGGYCNQPVEALFRQTCGQMANIAAASASGQDIRSDFFDLKAYTDALDTPGGCPILNGCRSLQCVTNAMRGSTHAVDDFLNSVAQGALILNVQAHANRYLIAHEEIFCSGSFAYAPCPTFDSDINRIANTNRPVYLMMWGCHSNQFPDGAVGLCCTDSTDAFGEQWVMLPDRGAIASFGSTSFEFLNTNSVYNLFAADAFYTTPPVPTPPPGQPRTARWILGEVMASATLQNAASPYAFQAIMNLTMCLFGDPMLRMDALPPRVFETTLDGTVVPDGGPFATDSPTASLTLVAKVRDETGVVSTTLAERDLASGVVTPVDSTLYTVALSDSGRQAILTGPVRPHVGNYDLQIRAVDGNGRLRVFALQVRTPIRYYADGVSIVNGVFVSNSALLRADIALPIPVTGDSLELYLDGVAIAATKSRTDATGRAWRLESLSGSRGAGSHTLQVAVGGRTAGLDQATFSISSEFTLRGVVAVSPGMQGSGCPGSIFQFELSEAASHVELLLMTVSGRRVASLSIPGTPGLNVYCWDGRDSEGNTVATGLYLYRLTATSASGRRLSQSGKMIRSR